jgi:hypothetical protein
MIPVGHYQATKYEQKKTHTHTEWKGENRLEVSFSMVMEIREFTPWWQSASFYNLNNGK